MIRPNASWVEARAARRPSASAGGTGSRALACVSVRRANGTPAQNAASSSGSRSRPAKRSHSCPSGIRLAVLKAAIWSSVISPAWLSL